MTTYTTAVYSTYATWKVGVEACAAGKLTAAGTWHEGGKTVWYTIIAT